MKQTNIYKAVWKIQIKAGMTESKAVQAIANQVIIQATSAAVVGLRETDEGLRWGTGTASLREVHRKWHGRPAVKQSSFNWNVTDKYVKLLNFQMEVTNILHTITYVLNEEYKIPIIKNIG